MNDISKFVVNWECTAVFYAPINGCDNVLGCGAGDDQLIGSDARDVLFGGAGDDTIVGGAGGDIIFADGNAGGLLGGVNASGTDALIVDGPATVLGNTASLRIDQAGVLVGYSVSDSTGRRIRYETSLGTQYLNPLFTVDYSALQNFSDTDIRGQGYSADGIALTADQDLGAHTAYVGEAGAGALTTNQETGNDVIYAGDVICGDGSADLVNWVTAGNDVLATKSVARCACSTFAAGQFDTNKQATNNVNWRASA